MLFKHADNKLVSMQFSVDRRKHLQQLDLALQEPGVRKAIIILIQTARWKLQVTSVWYTSGIL